MKRVNSERIRELRGDESQESLARRAGVSISTIRNAEAGRVAAPYPLTLQALADALGTQTDDLLLDEARSA